MKFQIFISSVQREFAEERKQLFSYLTNDPILSLFFKPFIFENHPASNSKTYDIYLKEVEKSDIYLGLLGNEYGTASKNSISPTEQEYNLANKLHKTCLIFIKKDNSQRHPKEIKFIQKVEKNNVRRSFTDYDELKNAVYKALVLYMEEKELIRTGPFDQAKNNEATIDDIDEEKVRNFIQLSKQRRNFKLSSDTPVENFLRHLDMIDEKGKLANASILLFGKKPQKFFITSEVKCAQFYGNKVEKPIPSLQIYKGDVFQLIDQATSFVLSRVDNWIGTRAQGLTAAVPTHPELPMEAVKEAIVNAVCHRDYTSKASVQVMLFRNRLEIWNPGQLPHGLTIDKLYKPHKSLPHNPLIAEAMQRCGYIEKTGTGTGDIVKQCLQYGLKKPLFQDDDDFKTIIWRKETQEISRNESENSPKVTEKVTEKGTENQRKILLIIKQDPSVSQDEIATIVGISRIHVNKNMKKMEQKGIIKRIGPDKGGHWEVK
jgi:predicted HTH transcriptional regulator